MARLTRLQFLALTLAILSAVSPSFAFGEEPKPKPSAKPDLPILNVFQAQPKVEVVADTVEYDRNASKMIAKNNVVVRDGDVYLTCDYAEVATDSKKVYAKGHVVIFKGKKAISRGEEIHYDFGSRTGAFPDGRVVTDPWIIEGKKMDQVSEGLRIIKDGTITTCPYEDPHYYMKASDVKIYESDKMIAKNIKLYVLDTPVFWWPFLILPLHERDNLPFVVNVGYNSRHGAFIETSAGFGVTKNIWGKWHLDWRSLRGVGGGADFHYDFTDEENAKKVLGNGLIKTYVTGDKRAPGRQDVSAEEYHATEDRTRGRLTWIHRTDFDEKTNLILRYNRVADDFFLQDFFRRESRAEIEPQSFATFTKNSENFGFFTHVEKQANRFESLVEKLPQVQFDWKTQPFFNEHLFYENQSSFAALAKTHRRWEQLEEDANRYDTFHEWSLPLNWNNIKFTPFTNVRGTVYSRQRNDPDTVFRGLWATGIDTRTQFYKTYEVQSDRLGVEINDLRHVLEPVFQFKTQTSSVSDEELGNFDSVDRLDDANIVTLGVENRLQTKRIVNGRMQRVDIVSLNTYMSYEIHPDGHSLGSQIYAPFEDGQTKSNFTVASQEVVLRPYDWLQTETRFDFDMSQTDMRVFNQDIMLRKGRFSVVFGYRYVRDFVDFNGGEQYLFDGSYILNPLWTLGGYTRWKGGQLQEWQVTATRDLHDFILDLGYNVRNSEIQRKNTEIFFNFRLKAFPELALRSGSRATFAEPRIGQTVAGSNQENPLPSQDILTSPHDLYRH